MHTTNILLPQQNQKFTAPQNSMAPKQDDRNLDEIDIVGITR